MFEKFARLKFFSKKILGLWNLWKNHKKSTVGETLQLILGSNYFRVVANDLTHIFQFQCETFLRVRTKSFSKFNCFSMISVFLVVILILAKGPFISIQSYCILDSDILISDLNFRVKIRSCVIYWQYTGDKIIVFCEFPRSGDFMKL